SFRLSNGPGSVAANAGVPLDQQTAWADSSRAGQWYNGQGYLGVSSPTFGTLTVFRQNSLTYDGAVDYDPMGSSRAFSPIQGMTGGVGDTESASESPSLAICAPVPLGCADISALTQVTPDATASSFDRQSVSWGRFFRSKPSGVRDSNIAALMQDRTSANPMKVLCNARPDHTSRVNRAASACPGRLMRPLRTAPSLTVANSSSERTTGPVSRTLTPRSAVSP